VEWKLIDETPFWKVKTQKSSVRVNGFVPREVVDQLIRTLSRFLPPNTRNTRKRTLTRLRLVSLYL